jgi:hypothetical protein
VPERSDLLGPRGVLVERTPLKNRGSNDASGVKKKGGLARGEIVLGILEILFVPMPDAWMRIRISDAGSGTMFIKK